MCRCDDGVQATALVVDIHKENNTPIMKKIMSMMLGLSLVLGAATLTFAAADDKDKPAPKDKTTKKTSKKNIPPPAQTDNKIQFLLLEDFRPLAHPPTAG